MKTKLHYCETHYHVDPPVDINPLILQAYSKRKILVLCSRQSIIDRIEKLKLKNVLACGWWEGEEIDLFTSGYLNETELSTYDVVVVIGKKRISEEFWPLKYQIENALKVDSCNT